MWIPVQTPLCLTLANTPRKNILRISHRQSIIIIFLMLARTAVVHPVVYTPESAVGLYPADGTKRRKCGSIGMAVYRAVVAIAQTVPAAPLVLGAFSSVG